MVYAAAANARKARVAVEAERRRRFVHSDDEVLQLAGWAVAIERHYGCSMDVEMG